MTELGAAMGWATGQFDLFGFKQQSEAPGRRLAKGGGGGSGAGAASQQGTIEVEDLSGGVSGRVVQDTLRANLYSVLADSAILFGSIVAFHALLLLCFRFVVNGRHYRERRKVYIPFYPPRTVGPIVKAAGERALLGLRTDNFATKVVDVQPASVFAGKLFPGDELIEVNGTNVVAQARSASQAIVRASMVTLMVQTPIGQNPDSSGDSLHKIRSAPSETPTHSNRVDTNTQSPRVQPSILDVVSSTADEEQSVVAASHMTPNGYNAVRMRPMSSEAARSHGRFAPSTPMRTPGSLESDFPAAPRESASPGPSSDSTPRLAWSDTPSAPNGAMDDGSLQKGMLGDATETDALPGGHRLVSTSDTTGPRAGTNPDDNKAALEEGVTKAGRPAPPMGGLQRSGTARRRSFMTKSSKKLSMKMSLPGSKAVQNLTVRQRFPHFTPLPDFLVFPNLEVLFFVFMSAGLMSSSISVLGGFLSGAVDDLWLIFLALVCAATVAAFTLHELLRVAAFFRQHRRLFVKEDRPASRDEVDDPALWVLAKLRLIPAISRVRGDYEPPEEDNEEPKRTERLLADPFAVWRRRKTPGDEYSSLVTLWLSDVGGGYRGTFYQNCKFLIHVSCAFMVGWGYDASPDSLRANTQALALVGLQGFLCVYCFLLCAAGDRLEGFVCGLEAGLMTSKLLCDWYAAYLNRVAREAYLANATATNVSLASPADLLSVVDPDASTFSNVALACVLGSVVAPLTLSIYDILVCPLCEFVSKIREGEEVLTKATCLQFTFACCLTPLYLLSSLRVSRVPRRQRWDPSRRSPRPLRAMPLSTEYLSKTKMRTAMGSSTMLNSARTRELKARQPSPTKSCAPASRPWTWMALVKWA